MRWTIIRRQIISLWLCRTVGVCRVCRSANRQSTAASGQPPSDSQLVTEVQIVSDQHRGCSDRIAPVEARHATLPAALCSRPVTRRPPPPVTALCSGLSLSETRDLHGLVSAAACHSCLQWTLTLGDSGPARTCLRPRRLPTLALLARGGAPPTLRGCACVSGEIYRDTG